MSTRVRERAAYSSNGAEHRAIHAIFLLFLEYNPQEVGLSREKILNRAWID